MLIDGHEGHASGSFDDELVVFACADGFVDGFALGYANAHFVSQFGAGGNFPE